jgi:hypothetical protein
VRVAIDLIGRKPYQIEKLGDALPRPTLSRSSRHRFIGLKAMREYRLFDYRARRHSGIERAERVLKNYLHLAPQLAQLSLSESEYIAPVEDHPP